MLPSFNQYHNFVNCHNIYQPVQLGSGSALFPGSNLFPQCKLCQKKSWRVEPGDGASTLVSIIYGFCWTLTWSKISLIQKWNKSTRVLITLACMYCVNPAMVTSEVADTITTSGNKSYIAMLTLTGRWPRE